VILAIDTTREWGSLYLDGYESILHAPLGFSGILFAEIDRLLKRCSVPLEKIDCFAVAVGPGTFTGVRIGMACAMGLAEATGKPVCGVSNLEALAEYGAAQLKGVTIDARRGELYAAVYGHHGQIVVPERVWNPEELGRVVPSDYIEWVKYEGPLAAAICTIARRKPWIDPARLEANYLRRSDAELNLKMN
jgi:tRNA threonylcarbamoyladenosine biosynthesis protein TsaB